MEDVQVTDRIEIQDLTNVPDSDENLFPAAKGVRGHIKRAGTNTNKGNNLKALSLGLISQDGITVTNPETGEEQIKYQGSYINHGWMDFVYWADPSRPDAKGWFKAGKHLIGFKQLMKALDKPLTGLVVDDEFFTSLIGNDIIFDVVHEKETSKDATGKNVPTGQISIKLKNIKKAE